MAVRVPRCRNPKGRQKENHRKIRKDQVINLIYRNIATTGALINLLKKILVHFIFLPYVILRISTVIICKKRRDYEGGERTTDSYEREVL